MKDKFRIWTEGEGLTWSTITELLGQDEDTPKRLQDLTLDLTDEIFKECELLKAKELEVEKLKEKLHFLKGNISGCLGFGRRRLKYEGMIKYIHDKKPVTISIDVVDGKLEIKEQKLTLFTT